MLSVLIVNWNTRSHLEICLKSLRAHPPQEPMEIIVVDNASTDGSAEMVARDFPEVQLIQPGFNTGYAAGNNLAFAVAQGEWLLTLNPDTELRPGVLQGAIDALRAQPKFGVLSVPFQLPSGEIQASVRGFPSFWGIVGQFTGLARRSPHGALGSYLLPAFDYAASGPAPQPMGTFLLFRREALAAIGDVKAPFDENFPIFFNEVDLLYRLAQEGWPAWYQAGLTIAHHHGASTRQVRPSMIWESHRSLLRYFSKHTRGFARLGLPLLAILVGLAAFVRARGYHAGFRTQRHHL